MQFDTYIYAIFLPIVFLAYWALRRQLNVQNIFLLAASYVFYGWWDWRFLSLIIVTSLSTFGTALLMRGDRSLNDKAWLTANVVLNIGILATFKYLNFFRDTFAALLNSFGVATDWPTLQILLPVGISFYTFQAISYTIDVYRGEIKPTRNLPAFMVFISFFPQLVAGPIERAKNLLPQFLVKKSFDYDNAVVGMRQILWGLTKKIVVADMLAGSVNFIFYNPAAMSASSLFFGAVLFAFQIYADFSGYSDIAIGSARLFNIQLSPNFRFPFFSRNMKELWQRWHITLMQWFRYYVYFPLGGSRRGKWRTAFNIMVVFALSGLWHGADWTFVIWGTVNGLLLLPFVFITWKPRTPDATWRDIPRCVITFLIFAAVFVAFRCTNISHLTEYCSRLVSGEWLVMPAAHSLLLFCTIITPLVVVEWITRHREFALQHLPFPTMVRWAIYWLLLLLITRFSVEANVQYIYFQF